MCENHYDESNEMFPDHTKLCPDCQVELIAIGEERCQECQDNIYTCQNCFDEVKYSDGIVQHCGKNYCKLCAVEGLF